MLYVTSRCPSKGCDLALAIINQYQDVGQLCIVQDVQSLQAEGHRLPHWLSAVPACVDLSTREVYLGSKAIDALKALFEAAAKERSVECRVDEGSGCISGNCNAASLHDEGEDAEMPGIASAPVSDAFSAIAGCEPDTLDGGDSPEGMAEQVQAMMQMRGLNMGASQETLAANGDP